jgi:hypothetical protein
MRKGHLIHRQILPEVDTRKNRIIILTWGFIAFMLKFTFCFVKSQRYIQPYPFNNQTLTVQAYIDFLSNCFVLIIIFALMHYLLPALRHYLSIITWIWVGYLFDYILTYNSPLAYYPFYGFNVPISYCTFGGFCFVGMISYEGFLYFKKRVLV